MRSAFAVLCTMLFASNQAQGFILSLVGPAVCEDKDATCKYYPAGMCQNFADWASVNCAVFCNFCTPVKTNPPPDCNDRISDCASYGDVCNKPDFQKWVDINCRATCGVEGCAKKTVAPTNPPTCDDLLPDCESYGKAACSNPLYKSWREKNCRRFCEIDGCKQTPAPATTPAPCIDLISDCAAYGNICGNPTYAAWAGTNCRKYCEIGGCKRDTPAPTPPTPRPRCEDRIPDCVNYGQAVCTNPEYDGWVGANCRKFCNRC